MVTVGLLLVCVVGVWWPERDGVFEERAGGGAEAQH